MNISTISAIVISLLYLTRIPLSEGRSANLKLTQNGYEGVLVAIHEDVPEDAKLIEQIQNIFRESSSTLFSATKNRAFFREITILIPSTWKHKPEYLPKTRETFGTADIRVAPANKKYGDTPYVKSFGGCGDAGEYIHLTPKFVVDEKVRDVFGDIGRVMVHEWGHFRWGLQEEYPAPGTGDQKWYFSTATKKFEAVRCSLSMKGRILQVTGANRFRICKLDNGLPDSDDCEFYPGFKINNPAKVSLMDRQGTKGVEGFCEKGGDEFHEHNREAPSRMNRLCGGKSAWEVMQQHEDFNNGANQPADKGEDQLKPTFKLVQAVKGASKCRLSLVLDISGSMNDNSKLAKMNKGLQKLIRYTLPEGTIIGTSVFSNRGRIQCGPRKITDDGSRKAFVRGCLPRNANGGTSIGSGLLKGVQNLGKTQGGDRIILLTDGQQNTNPGPTSSNVVTALDNAHVFLDAISFTAAADKSMVNLAQKYGGNYYFDSDNVNTNSLNEAFGKNPCGDEDENKDKDIPLLSDAGEVESGKNVFGSVNIDASIGRETKFIFDYASAGPTSKEAGILVLLTSPNGTEYTEATPQYHVDTDFLNIVISIDGLAEVGKWVYEISNESNKKKQAYKVNVLSKARNGGGTGGGGKVPEPLSIHATVKATGVAYPSPMVIYAEATRGSSPVLGLKVVASIDCPPLNSNQPSKPFELELLDNGIGADAKRDDGVYSRYFATFTQLGRYSFSIRVSNPNGTAKVRDFKSAGFWGGAPAFDEDNLRPFSDPTYSDDDIGSDVSRSTTAGASELLTKPGVMEMEINRRLRDKVDEIAPARIEDLVVMETNFESGNVTLAWTAPGDNYDEGKADRYQIIWRKNVTDGGESSGMMRGKRGIDDGGEEWLDVTSEAGERETLTLNVIQGGGVYGTFEFNIVATDIAGNAGDESNTATAGLGYVADIKDGQLPFPPTSSNTVVIVVVVVVVSLLVVLIIAAVAFKTKKDKKGVRLKEGMPEKHLRGVDNKGMVQVQVHSIDTTQQFKYNTGKEEVQQVTKTTKKTKTTTTTTSSSRTSGTEERYSNAPWRR